VHNLWETCDGQILLLPTQDRSPGTAIKIVVQEKRVVGQFDNLVLFEERDGVALQP